MHASINKPRLCDTLGSFDLKMTGSSYTDDARVTFQKVTFFLQYEIFHRDDIHLYFSLLENVTGCRDLRRTSFKCFASLGLLNSFRL